MKKEQIKLSDEQIKSIKKDKQKVVDSTKLVKK
jgi:hypothetical protein